MSPKKCLVPSCPNLVVVKKLCPECWHRLPKDYQRRCLQGAVGDGVGQAAAYLEKYSSERAYRSLPPQASVTKPY